ALRPFVATASALAAAGGLTIWLGLNTRYDRAEDVLGAASVVLAFRAIYLWLRPLSARVRQTVEERRTASTLVEAYGRDSLSFFPLRRDKSYLFSPSRRAFLAYRVVAGTVLVSGDPVGDDGELDALLDEARRLARASGWRLAVLGASDAQLDRYRR